VELIEEFRRALGTAAADDAERVARDLLGRWDEPHRRYHTRAHLEATLGAVRTLLAEPGQPDGGDAGAVELAVWFHDAVYTGRPGADEEDSAVLAEHVLASLGQPPERVAEVARLVRLTAGHDPAPDDVAGQLLCDADLAILAAPEPAYRAYTLAVRAEYAHVPDDAFRAGRAAVLRGLLAGGPPYRTPAGRRRWAGAADRNVTAELADLEAVRPPAG
jgi:predicted metal-dependent HD superfamily phosphohydrolase